MNEDTKSMGISFEEVKQLFQESIDDSANINELLKNVANKIYQKGFNDGRPQDKQAEISKDGEQE